MRRVLVTGVSRRRGIGHAVVRRLCADGCRVVAHGWLPADGWAHADRRTHSDAPSCATPTPTPAPAPAPDLPGVVLPDSDLADPGAPDRVVEDAAARVGVLDALVVAHARAQPGRLDDLDAATLDRTWAVNVRAPLLLVAAFARQCPGGGRIVLFTSGTDRGPMPDEIPYAVTKGALGAITPTLADALAERSITVTALNPGPTETGWADDATTAAVVNRLPRGRWNTPEEAADVVSLLLDDRAATITGGVLDAEAGFRRHAP